MRPALVLVLTVFATHATAQEAPPGALACSGCHGTQADAAIPLSGLSAEDIAQAMADFRSGAREATLMGRIAKGFTDEESKAIADWIAKEAH